MRCEIAGLPNVRSLLITARRTDDAGKQREAGRGAGLLAGHMLTYGGKKTLFPRVVSQQGDFAEPGWQAGDSRKGGLDDPDPSAILFLSISLMRVDRSFLTRGAYSPCAGYLQSRCATLFSSEKQGTDRENLSLLSFFSGGDVSRQELLADTLTHNHEGGRRAARGTPSKRVCTKAHLFHTVCQHGRPSHMRARKPAKRAMIRQKVQTEQSGAPPAGSIHSTLGDAQTAFLSTRFVCPQRPAMDRTEDAEWPGQQSTSFGHLHRVETNKMGVPLSHSKGTPRLPVPPRTGQTCNSYIRLRAQVHTGEIEDAGWQQRVIFDAGSRRLVDRRVVDKNVRGILDD